MVHKIEILSGMDALAWMLLVWMPWMLWIATWVLADRM